MVREDYDISHEAGHHQVARFDDGGTPIGPDGERIFDKPVEGGAAEEEGGDEWL